MSDKVRIQDDLYTFVNQEKLEQLVIPEDKPVAGGFVELADLVEKTLMGDFEELAKSKNYPDANMEKAVKLYALTKDIKRRNYVYEWKSHCRSKNRTNFRKKRDASKIFVIRSIHTI